MKSDEPIKQKLKFRVTEVTSQEEGYPVTELLNHTPFSKGWQSSRFCDYPQEITFEFPTYVRIKQLQFLSHQYKISSKIEIFILNPKINKKYKKIGYLCLDSNEKSNFRARELKSVNIDYECLKIKIALERCYVNQLNNFIQVGLIAFNALGFPTVENPLEKPTIIKERQDENLEDQILYDPITYKRLKALSKAKDRAVELEDFNEAMKIKQAIDRLKAVSNQLIQLEERKQIAIKNDDFKAASIIKYEIERLRNAVAGINIDAYDFSPDNVMPSYNNMSHNKVRKDNYNNEINREDDDMNDYKKRQFKTNIHQDKHLEEFPINSEMILNNKNYENKSHNINQGNRLVGKFEPILEDHDSKPIRGMSSNQRVDDSTNFKMNQSNNNINDNEEPVDDIDNDIPANVYKYAEPLIPYLSYDVMKLVFSNEWKKKEKGLNYLIDEIKKHPHSQLLSSHPQDKIVTAIFGATAHTLTSTVSSVILTSLETIKVLLNKFHGGGVKGYYKGDIDNYSDTILILTLEKIGDSSLKIKERAENTVLEMAASSTIGSKVVFEHLISGQIKKSLVNSTRHISARLNLINRMIDNFGLNKEEVGIQSLLNFAFSNYKSPNKEIRDSAYNLIMNCYKFLGGEIRAYYNDLRQPQKELLEEGFNKIDLEQVGDKYKDNNKFNEKEINKKLQGNKGKKMDSNDYNDNSDYTDNKNNNVKNSNNKFSNPYGHEEGKIF